MSPTILSFIKDPDLPPQLQWKYAHEPELLGWTIRARNYNTFVANFMFWFCFTAITIGSILIYFDTHPDPIFSGTMALMIFTIGNIALISMTHQSVNYACRFTESGLEYCKWKDFPKWTLTFLKWLAGITAIIFISLAAVDPTFLMGALAGPGGIGLMYLSMLHSKSYQDMHTQYNHHEFNWSDFTQLAIATNREIVDLKFSMTLEGNDYVTNGSHNIFCRKKQKEMVADFIKPYLSPDVPFIRAKVNVPMSTE